MPTFEERLAAIRGGQSFEDRLAAERGGADVRGQIAARSWAGSPPPARYGDPNAKSESTLERIFPAAAHPIVAAGGLLSAMNPIPALSKPGGIWSEIAGSEGSARYAAIQRLLHGGPNAGTTRDAFEATIPLFGSMLANSGRQMESTDPVERARGFGGAIGATSGPKIVGKATGVAAPFLESRANTQYGKIFGPRADPGEVAQVTPNLLKERIRVGSPESLSDIADARATAADKKVSAAISQMENPIDRNAVLSEIEKAKLGQFNKVPGPKGISSLEPAGPDAQATIDFLNKYSNNIRENATGGQITPENARTLRQNYDLKPGKRGVYRGNDVTTPDVIARKGVANSLRGELNKDPNVKAANAEESLWLSTKDLADEAPKNKPMITGHQMGRAVIGALAAPYHGFTGGLIEASVAIPVLSRLMTSPGWRTASAALKAQVADLLLKGDVQGATEVTMRVLGARNVQNPQDEYLRRKMLANE